MLCTRTSQLLIEPLVLARTNYSLITLRWGNIRDREMWWIGAAASEITLQWVGNICRGYFLLDANVVESISPRGGGWRVCVQRLGSPIFQLINFLFTHLFLNVLSDGNAADCSSEVLTWQMGLKGEVSQCQRQDFQFKVEGYFLFYYSWGVGIIWRKLTHMASYCAPYTIHIDQFGLKWPA